MNLADRSQHPGLNQLEAAAKIRGGAALVSGLGMGVAVVPKAVAMADPIKCRRCMVWVFLASSRWFYNRSKGADPDIAKAHRIAMILQHERAFGREAVGWGGRRGGPLDGDVILDQHAIVQHGEGTGLDRASR